MDSQKDYIVTVADCLQYLEMAGWSELIDTPWRGQVEKDLREEFGDACSTPTFQTGSWSDFWEYYRCTLSPMPV